jgi:hypothetical protein
VQDGGASQVTLDTGEVIAVSIIRDQKRSEQRQATPAPPCPWCIGTPPMAPMVRLHSDPELVVTRVVRGVAQTGPQMLHRDVRVEETET